MALLIVFAAAVLVAIGPQASLGEAAAKVVYVKTDGFDFWEIALALGTIALAIVAWLALNVARHQLNESNRAAKIEATLALLTESSQGTLDWAFTFFDVGRKARNSRAAVWKVWEELVVRNRPKIATGSRATLEGNALALADFLQALDVVADVRQPETDKKLEATFRLAIFSVSTFCERACIEVKKEIVDADLLLEHCDWRFTFTYYALEDVLHDLHDNEDYIFEYFLTLATDAQKRYATRKDIDLDVARTLFRPYKVKSPLSSQGASV